ncbi:MAG: BCAM0308 family protein [Candidatus Bipolaricaulia bacterium]
MRVGDRRGNVGHESKNPYYERRKYREPTICPRCSLVYHNGHWIASNQNPKGAYRELCPACRREMDRYPGGIVRLEGNYLMKKKEEILSIARNREKQTRVHRPLQRIMWVETEGEAIEIYTTSDHLAMSIGKSINHAQGGELTFKGLSGDKFIRVYWRRDE